MSKFLDLVEENTPINEGAEPLGQFMNRLEGLYNTDYMKTFIDSYHALVEDIQKDEPFEVEDIIKFLTFKMEKFPPAVEDAEDGEEAPAEDSELRVDDGKVEQAQKALKAAEAITGAKDARAGMMGRDPKKNVERAVGKLYNKVAKQLNNFTKEF